MENISNRITPKFITELAQDEIFVFGSNLQGLHMGGAARIAYEKFGAVWGQGVGLQGSSYAIPMNKFLVTRVGCGIAGFTDAQIAPLFSEAQWEGSPKWRTYRTRHSPPRAEILKFIFCGNGGNRRRRPK